MRLLAITSPDAHGAITEAEATIGEITLGGTLGFVVFVGLPAGAWSACCTRSPAPSCAAAVPAASRSARSC